MCDEPYMCVWGIELTSEPGGEDLWVCELGCDYGPDLVVCKGESADLCMKAAGQCDFRLNCSYIQCTQRTPWD